jgi:hypothetical protein
VLAHSLLYRWVIDRPPKDNISVFSNAATNLEVVRSMKRGHPNERAAQTVLTSLLASLILSGAIVDTSPFIGLKPEKQIISRLTINK